jgi:hypothetical protein
LVVNSSDDRDERRRQGARRDELEDEVRDAERREERVELGRRNALAMTMTRM